MAMQKCTIIVFGRLELLFFHRKSILCMVFLMRELMFSVHFRSWKMMAARKWQDSNVLTMESTSVICIVLFIYIFELISNDLQVMSILPWVIEHGIEYLYFFQGIGQKFHIEQLVYTLGLPGPQAYNIRKKNLLHTVRFLFLFFSEVRNSSIMTTLAYRW